MDPIEVIRTTRAIRRFTDEPVTVAEIQRCIDAAIQAPSGGNIQPWAFVVVTEPAVKEAVGEIYRKAYHRYEAALLASLGAFRTPEDEATFFRGIEASRHLADNMSVAPALIAVCMPDIDLTLRDDDGPLDIGTLHASVFPAVQNLMVAARSLGIGSTMTTAFRIYQDEVRAALEIPDGMQVVALIALGRPRGKFGVAARKPARIVTHWNRFGNREAPA
jgi:nitroreductase